MRRPLAFYGGELGRITATSGRMIVADDRAAPVGKPPGGNHCSPPVR